MQERHQDRLAYFNEQVYTTEKFVLPLIQRSIAVDRKTEVLEIGCGEGGNLKPFVDKGCKRVVGVDMSEYRINLAKDFLSNCANYKNVELVVSDIYDADEIGQFDVIIMRDVLEHIFDQSKFMGFVKKFLKPGGKFYLGFPPWQNPFGGHQQIAQSKWLSKTPFIHLLPKRMYKYTLEKAGEIPRFVNELMNVKETGITIEQFEKIIKKEGYQKEQRVFYFINPNYEVKFKLKPRVQSPFISSIPYIRNFFITTNYYVLSLK